MEPSKAKLEKTPLDQLFQLIKKYKTKKKSGAQKKHTQIPKEIPSNNLHHQVKDYNGLGKQGIVVGVNQKMPPTKT